MSTETIEFSCSSCGSKDFKFPTNPQADDVVICNGCGAKENYAAIKAAAIKQVKDSAIKAFTDGLK